MNEKELDNYKKAGEIVKTVKEYAKSLIKKDMPLLEIAEKIEAKIIELKGKPAFPVTLGINEFTAHVTPSYNDEELAHRLLKVDFGVHINGYTADNAFSIDLENNEENVKLITASEEALEAAIDSIKKNESLGEIGQSIQDIATKYSFSPIHNLSGHSIEQNNLHAGITIPNHNNNNPNKLSDGVYAIEPFITSGIGEVYDGKPSGIYEVRKSAAIRDRNAREIYNYILEEYETLPFCSRWLVKKFGTRALISLKLIEQTGSIHHFSQLIEKSKKPVAQSEATILIHNEKVEVIT